jgi:hypothetical protein
MDAQKFPHVDEHQSSTASHEMGIVENAPTGMRRDLSRRHINMIGLAGMIVSFQCFVRMFQLDLLTIHAVQRERVYFLLLAMHWQSLDP